MNQKTNTTLLLLLMLPLCSCQPTIKLLYGIHQPRERNEKELIRYAEKKSLESGNLFYVKDTASFSTITKDLPSLTDVEIYNRQGHFIHFRERGGCPAPTDRYLKTICNSQTNDADSAKTIQDRMKQIVAFQNNMSYTGYTPDAYDYTILIYWASYLGTLNKKGPRFWEDLLKEQKTCRIKVFKISLDQMECWNTGE